MSLAWDAATGNGKDWWYLVNGTFRVDPPTTTFTHPTLQPATTYTFFVIALLTQLAYYAPSSDLSV